MFFFRFGLRTRCWYTSCSELSDLQCASRDAGDELAVLPMFRASVCRSVGSRVNNNVMLISAKTHVNNINR